MGCLESKDDVKMPLITNDVKRMSSFQKLIADSRCKSYYRATEIDGHELSMMMRMRVKNDMKVFILAFQNYSICLKPGEEFMFIDTSKHNVDSVNNLLKRFRPIMLKDGLSKPYDGVICVSRDGGEHRVMWDKYVGQIGRASCRERV